MKWHITLYYGITICLINVVRPEGFINEDEYDNVYRLDGYFYKTIDQNQYQKSLIKWDGNGRVSYSLTFYGQNNENVDTTYTVCFNVLDYNISGCKVNVRYSYHYLEYGDVKLFRCNDTIPKQWCHNEQATFVLESDENTSSYLRLEVTVKAGKTFCVADETAYFLFAVRSRHESINLSIRACLWIAGAIAIFILMIAVHLALKYGKRKRSEGRVVRVDTDPATSGAEAPLVSYPMTVIKSVGKRTHNYRTGVIQVQAQNMATHQVTLPATSSATPTAPSNDLSDLPPSYEECTQACR